MGVTFPVATTLLARSPFSTFASLEGSILVPPRVAAKTPPAITRMATTATTIQITSLRRFFLLFPFPFTTASYRQEHRNVLLSDFLYAVAAVFVPEISTLIPKQAS